MTENDYKPGDQDGCWPWHKSILIIMLVVIQILHEKVRVIIIIYDYENNYKPGD